MPSAFWIACLAVASVGITLNLFIMVVVGKYTVVKLNPHQMLVVNQCSCHLLMFAVLIPVFLIDYMYFPGDFDLMPCVSERINTVLSDVVNLTIMNQVVITVDHLIALMASPLRYQAIVTTKRITVTLIFVYILCACLWATQTVLAVRQTPDYEECLNIFCPRHTATCCCLLAYAILIMHGLVSFTAVGGIFVVTFLVARNRHEFETEADFIDHKCHLYNARTSFWIVLTFGVLLLPQGITTGVLTPVALLDWTYIDIVTAVPFVVFVKGLCDPVIYAVRLPNPRGSYWKMVFQLGHTNCRGMLRQDEVTDNLVAHENTVYTEHKIGTNSKIRI